MKKVRTFTLLALIAILTTLLFVGCKKEERITSVSLKDNDPNTPIEMAIGGFDYNAYTVVVTYESGSTEEIALAEDMISETDLFKLYQIGEHDITVEYGAQKYTFKVSVKRATFGELSFPENNVFTYDGKEHVVEVDGYIPANAVVTYLGGNSFVNAGTYDVTAVVFCEGYVTEKLSTTVRIERAKYDMSSVKFESKEVVYDGNVHSVAISGVLPEGVSSPTYTINEKTTSSATDVGEYKVKATFAHNDPNYEPIPEMEATLKITPAEYTVRGVDIVFKDESGATLSEATRIYDGKSITFDLNDYSKLSKKISVSFSVYDKDGNVISTSNKKTNIINAGVYTVKAEFSLADGKNYMPLTPIVRTFEVLKTDYPTIVNVRLETAQATYDGKAHSIKIVGTLPSGVTVSYRYYLNRKLVVDAYNNPVESVVDAGRYTVEAIFTHSDGNCKPIPSLSATLNIEKMKLTSLRFGLSTEPVIEYSGEPYEFDLQKWKENNDDLYAGILQYGTVKYYVFDATLNKYVEMGENERPTEIGKYRISIDLSIAEGHERNYCFSNGDRIQSFSAFLEIQKKKTTTPKVTFEYEDITVYTGVSNNVEYSITNADMALITVTATYFKCGIDNNGNPIYTALENGVFPTNAGVYKFIVTITLNDTQHNAFANGETSVEYYVELTIEKNVIEVSDILFNDSDVTYYYNGGQLQDAPLEYLNEAVKDYVSCKCVQIAWYNKGTWNLMDMAMNIGDHKVRYEVTLLDAENYIFSNGENSVQVSHSFSIVQRS